MSTNLTVQVEVSTVSPKRRITFHISVKLQSSDSSDDCHSSLPQISRSILSIDGVEGVRTYGHEIAVTKAQVVDNKKVINSVINMIKEKLYYSGEFKRLPDIIKEIGKPPRRLYPPRPWRTIRITKS